MSQNKKNQNKIENTPLPDFTMTGDTVLLKAIEIEEDEGILTPSQYDEKPMFGEVVGVGPGTYSFDGGNFIPTTIKKGDLVMFGRYASDKIRHKGEEYLIIKEIDIKAVI